MDHFGKKLEIYSEIHADLPKFRIYYQMNEDIQGDRAACAKPPVDFKMKVPLWPVQARPGQNRTFVLKSTGGFAQAALSPCIDVRSYLFLAYCAQNNNSSSSSSDLSLISGIRMSMKQRQAVTTAPNTKNSPDSPMASKMYGSM